MQLKYYARVNYNLSHYGFTLSYLMDKLWIDIVNEYLKFCIKIKLFWYHPN